MRIWDDRQHQANVLTFAQAETMFGAGSLLAVQTRALLDAERQECTGRFVRAIAHWFDGDAAAANAWMRAAILYAPRCA